MPVELKVVGPVPHEDFGKCPSCGNIIRFFILAERHEPIAGASPMGGDQFLCDRCHTLLTRI